MRNRHGGVDGLDLALDGGAQSHWVATPPHRPGQRNELANQFHHSLRHLGFRKVHDSEIAIRHPGFLDRSHHAHDFPRRVRKLRAEALADGDHLADGVLIRPVALGHVLIDNHHRRGVAGIGLGEAPAAQQRNAKRLEVMPGNEPVLLVAVVLVALGGRLAGDIERQVNSVADSWQ